MADNTFGLRTPRQNRSDGSARGPQERRVRSRPPARQEFQRDVGGNAGRAQTPMDAQMMTVSERDVRSTRAFTPFDGQSDGALDRQMMMVRERDSHSNRPFTPLDQHAQQIFQPSAAHHQVNGDEHPNVSLRAYTPLDRQSDSQKQRPVTPYVQGQNGMRRPVTPMDKEAPIDGGVGAVWNMPIAADSGRPGRSSRSSANRRERGAGAGLDLQFVEDPNSTENRLYTPIRERTPSVSTEHRLITPTRESTPSVDLPKAQDRHILHTPPRARAEPDLQNGRPALSHNDITLDEHDQILQGPDVDYSSQDLPSTLHEQMKMYASSTHPQHQIQYSARPPNCSTEDMNADLMAIRDHPTKRELTRQEEEEYVALSHKASILPSPRKNKDLANDPLSLKFDSKVHGNSTSRLWCLCGFGCCCNDTGNPEKVEPLQPLSGGVPKFAFGKFPLGANKAPLLVQPSKGCCTPLESAINTGSQECKAYAYPLVEEIASAL